MRDAIGSRRTPAWQRHELPTWGLIVAVYAGWFALTGFYRVLPWWLLLPLAAWFMTWHMSLQHELLHGHPTHRRWLNTALGFAPLNLWLPYVRYRELHIAHHRTAHLADPLEDPESYYVTPEDWHRRGPLARAWTRMLNTLAGRLVLGPLRTIGSFLVGEARLLCTDRSPHLWRVWAAHLLGVAAVLYWVLAVCRIPLWAYLGFFVYTGCALGALRAFAEHRAAPAPGHRTAIVEAAPLFAILFLNNNLHVLHHERPALPWYALPALYRTEREALLRKNGGLVYRGYAKVMRRYLFAEHHAPPHP